jgi:MFS family permease
MQGDKPVAPEADANAGWRARTFSALRYPYYRLLWLLTLGPLVAAFIVLTAQGLAAHDLTGDSSAVGVVLFAQGLPALLLMPLAGAVADRVSKRTLIGVTNVALAVSAATVAIAALSDALTIELLTANAFVGGAMFAFIVPARIAYIGELVPADERGNAIALFQIGRNGSRIAGPFLAAALLAWETLGYGGVFLLVTVSYLAMSLMTLAMPRSPAGTGGPRTSVIEDIRLGVRHVRETPRLMPLVVGFTVVVSVSQTYSPLMPAFTKEVLGTGNEGFGLVAGAAAFGGLLASIAIAGAADSPKAVNLIHFSTIGTGAGLLLMGFAPSFTALLLLIIPVGAFTSCFQILTSAVALKLSSLEYYGRVQSLMAVSMSTTAMVGLPIGWLADQIGERTVLHIMAVVVWAVGALMFVWIAASGRQAARAVAEAG